MSFIGRHTTMARPWRTQGVVAFLLIVNCLQDVQSSFIAASTSADRKHAVLFSALESSESSSEPSWEESADTDRTFLVPRFFEGEVDQGSYPSPLHSVHVKRILSSDESKKCLQLACDYADSMGRWERPDFARHATYATCDFAVQDCEILESYLNAIGFNDRIWNHLSALFGVAWEDMSYLDFFCSHYRARTDDRPDAMDRLEAHRDGSLLSFTVTLTEPDQFEGGGTFFDALRDVVDASSDSPILLPGGTVKPTRAGDGVLHSALSRWLTGVPDRVLCRPPVGIGGAWMWPRFGTIAKSQRRRVPTKKDGS
jgi:hypothetical protein